MLTSPRTVVFVVLYALAAAAVIAPAAVWSRSYPYIFGYFAGSLVLWAAVSAGVAWLFTLFFRADRRAPIARATFSIVLFVIATLMIYARIVVVATP